MDVSRGRWRMEEPCVVYRLARWGERQSMKPGSGLGGGPKDDADVELIEGGGWWVTDMEV